jgi:hypothetical protein
MYNMTMIYTIRYSNRDHEHPREANITQAMNDAGGRDWKSRARQVLDVEGKRQGYEVGA